MTTNPTHARLLDIAIEHFGRTGLHGTSTRDIARAADTPMSSITYHFGGKEGLYLAAAQRITDRISERLGPALAQAERINATATDTAAARVALHGLYRHIAVVLVGGDIAPIARFIVREQADPTAAFSRIYDGVMAPVLTCISGLLRVVAGNRIGAAEARLRAMSLTGQVLVFRVARETALRSQGWKKIGKEELEAIQAVVADHLDAVIDRLEHGSSPARKGTRGNAK
jgi:AcrR family transcriptional regulator